jgi:flagellar biosynthesis protein FliR
VLARILPVSILSPAFGARVFDARCRMGIAVVLVIVITPVVMPVADPGFTGALVVQLIIGTVLAFFTSIPFYAIQSVGEWIDLHRGETLSSVLIPQMQSRTSSLGRVYLLFSIVLFFACDGHMVLVSQMIASFSVIPVSSFGWEAVFLQDGVLGVDEWNHHVARLFLIAVKCALPAVSVLWMTDWLLGILNRTAPSLQVFFLGLPLKMWIGVAVTGIVLGFCIEGLKDYIFQSLCLFT